MLNKNTMVVQFQTSLFLRADRWIDAQTEKYTEYYLLPTDAAEHKWLIHWREC